jgi:uncharacterized protein (TIGR00730 family)
MPDPGPTDHPPRDPLADTWGKVATSQEEIRFLRGPQSRRFEFLRACRIFVECIRGFRALHFVGPCVTVFGSARFSEDHRYYRMAREVGGRLAEEGFTVMTGGGPGIMEAANRGAKDVGGRSVGCNIELPMEQHPNPYLDRWVTFRYFFVRKVMLVKYSYAFVVLPGGFGTLDEVFETLTLVQTGKISGFPIVLMGTDYWGPLLEFMRKDMVEAGTISATDPSLLRVTDSPEQAVGCIRDTVVQRFGLTYGPTMKRSRLLGERAVEGAETAPAGGPAPR